MGILPQALTNYLALLGWGAEGGKRETFTLEELNRQFTLERVTPSPAVFDWDKLYWLNRHYMKLAPPPEIEDLAWPYFAALHWLPPRSTEPTADIEAWFGRLLALYLPAVDRLDQLPGKAAAFWLYDAAEAKRNEENQALLFSPAGILVVGAFAKKILAESGAMTPETFKALVNQIKAETGVKGAELFHPIRIMLTGAHSGPEFDKLIPLIEDGSRLPLPIHVPSVRERVALALEAYGAIA
jgi:glutamyl-tRNA synthetase/nondiscriminating glutamyl-tRNA synthetase